MQTVVALLMGVAGSGCDASTSAPSTDRAAPVAAAEAALDAMGTTPIEAGTGLMPDARPHVADAARLDASDRDVGRDAEGGASAPDAGEVDAAAPIQDAGMAASGEGGVRGFILGADITWAQADESFGATFSDGRERDLLEILRDHGFNYVRLRTFVDPRAADGYDRENGFGDLAHTIAFGKRIKALGLGFLLDLHYSDNWADPGKQCVPVAWQKHTRIEPLASALHDYTKDVLSQLIAAGARPDLVQLGNEITPGMLLHLCDAAGMPLRDSPVQGSISNWTNLGALLRAGASAVREVDPDVGLMLHIDRCGDKGGHTGYALQTSIDFVTQAKAQKVDFQYFGESCYQQYQGDVNSAANTELSWSKTLGALAQRFPDLHLIAAEYGPLQREINDIVFNLPQQQGAGTFLWEPTREGDWNRSQALFTSTWPKYTATSQLSLYDQMSKDYASRK